jgi:hypothetical protein
MRIRAELLYDANPYQSRIGFSDLAVRGSAELLIITGIDHR